MKLSLDDIALFVHIVRWRGLTAAATQLQLPPATVTRRLQKLEETLGVRLLHRSARQFRLTNEGEVYYQAYAGLVHQFEAQTRQLSADMHQLSGDLRVSAPANLSAGMLQPMWSAFIQQYPDIRLQMLLSNRNEDLVEKSIDLALRIGEQSDLALYQKRLATLPTVLVASPAYVAQAGALTDLNDLDRQRLIVVSPMPVWPLTQPETGRQESFHPVPSTELDDLSFAAKLVCDGLGIALLPISEVGEMLRQGRLIRVLPQWSGPRRPMFAVWPSGRLLNARARCLLEFVQEYLRLNIELP